MKTLNNITINSTNTDNIALSIMKWEIENFDNPYSFYSPNSSLQKFLGVYEINGSYRWFIRDGPVSWTLYSRLANCWEYSTVFVNLMKIKDVKARIIHTPGEDHVWSEYLSDGFKITVDPSGNQVVLDKKIFAQNRNWSYIESLDLFNISDKIDVSDEYIERVSLIVVVNDNEKHVKNIDVTIKSTQLMKSDPKRYKEPKVVLTNKTDENGLLNFRLGEKEYIIEVRNSYILFDYIYSKNATVTKNQINTIDFDLSKDAKKIEFLGILKRILTN
jgi:hypothetical protein